MFLNDSLDQLIGALASPFRWQADALLDLRECALGRKKPGRCVACYFLLRETASDALLAELCPLRRWLEEHVEVVATADQAKPVETLPLNLANSSDLESYCRSIMADFREDRVLDAARVDLGFRYRESAGEAA
ncbi:MAG: hypothetical protein ACREIA_01725 [Opitutaceae bacterium]